MMRSAAFFSPLCIYGRCRLSENEVGYEDKAEDNQRHVYLLPFARA